MEAIYKAHHSTYDIKASGALHSPIKQRGARRGLPLHFNHAMYQKDQIELHNNSDTGLASNLFQRCR